MENSNQEQTVEMKISIPISKLAALQEFLLEGIPVEKVEPEKVKLVLSEVIEKYMKKELTFNKLDPWQFNTNQGIIYLMVFLKHPSHLRHKQMTLFLDMWKCPESTFPSWFSTQFKDDFSAQLKVLKYHYIVSQEEEDLLKDISYNHHSGKRLECWRKEHFCIEEQKVALKLVA
jgi:hypothetical protein